MHSKHGPSLPHNTLEAHRHSRPAQLQEAAWEMQGYAKLLVIEAVRIMRYAGVEGRILPTVLVTALDVGCCTVLLPDIDRAMYWQSC